MPEAFETIATRQRSELLFEAPPPPLGAGACVTLPVRLVEGFSAIGFFGVSDQPFTVSIEESCSAAGPFSVTQVLTSALDPVSGLQVVCDRVAPCAPHMQVTICNTGLAPATILDVCGTGIPKAASGGAAGAGNQGPQGPGIGNTGPQGPQSWQGPQGPQSSQGPQAPQGAQSFQGPQGALPGDIFAADRVVSLVAGEGTDLTVASALTALAATGGKIYVKKGTFAIAASLTPAVDKCFVIEGSGDDTIFDLGANNIPLFDIADGYTLKTNLYFKDFHVLGTEAGTQSIWQYNDSHGLAEIYGEGITDAHVDIKADVQNGSNSSAGPGNDDVRFHWKDCHFQPNDNHTSGLVNTGASGPFQVVVYMEEVRYCGDNLFDKFGFLNFGVFVNITLFLEASQFATGGVEDDFMAIFAAKCEFSNNDPDTSLKSLGLFGGFPSTMFGSSSFEKCYFKQFYLQSFDASVFSTCQFQDCKIDLNGSGGGIETSEFNKTLATYPTTLLVKILGFGSNFFGPGNFFTGFSFPTGLDTILEATPARGPTIIGNDFSDANASVQLLLLENSGIQVIANVFPSNPSIPSVNDLANDNYYYGNSFLFGPGTAPIIQTQTLVDGVRQLLVPAGFTGGPATIMRYRNDFEAIVPAKGYIKNLAVANLTIDESYITFTQGTATRTTVLATGAKMTLDPFNLPAGIDFQVKEYKVAGTFAGGAAGTYEGYFTGAGALANI